MICVIRYSKCKQSGFWPKSIRLHPQCNLISSVDVNLNETDMVSCYIGAILRCNLTLCGPKSALFTRKCHRCQITRMLLLDFFLRLTTWICWFGWRVTFAVWTMVWGALRPLFAKKRQKRGVGGVIISYFWLFFIYNNICFLDRFRIVLFTCS